MEHIFYKLLKSSDALRPYLQYYAMLRDDHPDRTCTFLREMVDKAIREERHRKYQEELVISGSGGSKARSAMPGVQQPGDAYPKAENQKGKFREGLQAGGLCPKGERQRQGQRERQRKGEARF